jgi:hypothetical protein
MLLDSVLERWEGIVRFIARDLVVITWMKSAFQCMVLNLRVPLWLCICLARHFRWALDRLVSVVTNWVSF